jgi:hypothetical protein
MSPVPPKRILSPDKRFEARLSPTDGSAWDRSHASLALHDLSFGTRLFGWHGVWSPCSRYFAIAEWRRVADPSSPEMQLVVVDLQEHRECVVEQVPNGFVEPVYFLADAVKYTKIAPGMEERAVVHRGVDELSGWQPVEAGQLS